MTEREAFRKLHEGLPRQGPGSLETANHLFGVVTADSVPTTAIDMGCGTGAGTLFLAGKNVNVTAIDTNVKYLDKVNASARKQGLDRRITTLHASMDDVSVPKPVDLIWAEGTMYIIGWKKALTLWSDLLTPGGIIAATDCFWLTDSPSPQTKKFWEVDPNMMNLEQLQRLVQQCGYELLDTYVQPDSDWFTPYYDPLQANINNNLLSTDPAMIKVVEQAQEEINIRKEYGDEYGHIGFVMKKASR